MQVYRTLLRKASGKKRERSSVDPLRLQHDARKQRFPHSVSDRPRGKLDSEKLTSRPREVVNKDPFDAQKQGGWKQYDRVKLGLAKAKERQAARRVARYAHIQRPKPKPTR